MKNYYLVGRTIKEQREKYAMTIPMLAKFLGITPSNLESIELGNSLPTLEMLQKLENKFGFECSSCIEFILFYADKYKKDIKNIEKKEVPKVQVCPVREEEPDDDKFEMYDRRNGNYLF